MAPLASSIRSFQKHTPLYRKLFWPIEVFHSLVFIGAAFFIVSNVKGIDYILVTKFIYFFCLMLLCFFVEAL